MSGINAAPGASCITTMTNDMLAGKPYTSLPLGIFIVNGARVYLYLRKHRWVDGCWDMGNLDSYAFGSYDFRTLFLQNQRDVDKVFETSNLTNEQWWAIMDLYKQAYALKDAEVEETSGDIGLALDTAWDILLKIQRSIELDYRVDLAIKAMGE